MFISVFACGMITNERLDDRQPWEKPGKIQDLGNIEEKK